MNIAKTKLLLVIMALVCSFLLFPGFSDSNVSADSESSVYLSQGVSKIDEEVVDEPDEEKKDSGNPFTGDMVNLYILVFAVGVISCTSILLIKKRKATN